MNAIGQDRGMTATPDSLRGDWSYPTAIRFGVGRIAELAEACRSVGIGRPLLAEVYKNQDRCRLRHHSRRHHS
jgi:hypothetical protein